MSKIRIGLHGLSPTVTSYFYLNIFWDTWYDDMSYLYHNFLAVIVTRYRIHDTVIFVTLEWAQNAWVFAPRRLVEPSLNDRSLQKQD